MFSSYRFDVLTGKFEPKSVVVGADPVALRIKNQLPVFVLIPTPIFPGVALANGSMLVGLDIESVNPTKARLPAARISVAKRTE